VNTYFLQLHRLLRCFVAPRVSLSLWLRNSGDAEGNLGYRRSGGNAHPHTHTGFEDTHLSGSSFAFEGAGKFVAGLELFHDVHAANQLALDVQLRVRGPVGELLETLAHLGVRQDVEIVVRHFR